MTSSITQQHDHHHHQDHFTTLLSNTFFSSSSTLGIITITITAACACVVLISILTARADLRRVPYFVGLWRFGFRIRRGKEKDGEKEKEKGLRAGGFISFGEWTAQPFTYPVIPPVLLPVEKLEVPKYRPFKWGAYNITMGIRSMPFEEWIEVDEELARYYAIRKRRMEIRGEKVVRVLSGRKIVVGDEEVMIPGGEIAVKELVYELSEYLSRRYPLVYSVTRESISESKSSDVTFRGVSFIDGWYSEGKIRTITIIPVGVTFELEKEDPMTVAGLLIQDDLALMIEGSDGRYYFQAGAICLPGFWRMEDKLGMPLEEIHISGDVPQYREKLQKSMARFFSKMRMDKAVLRNNYFFQIVFGERRSRDVVLGEIDEDELAWSDSTNGDEGVFDQVRKHEEVEQTKPTTGIENVRFRTERQSLRRLGVSGAVVFSIRTYITKLVDMVKEDDLDIPSRLASAIKSWPNDVARYKGRKLYEEVVIPYLEGNKNYP